MRKLSFATNNDSNYTKVLIPSGYNDLTVDQFQRIISEWDGKDKLKIFSILLGSEIDGISHSKDPKLIKAFHNCIQFLYNERIEWDKLPLPEFFSFTHDHGMNQIRIPKNLGRLTLGQNIAISDAMDKVRREIKPDQIAFTKDFPFESIIAYACSVYLQPLITNSQFDDEKAAEIEKQILLLPIVKMYPIGFFFLTQLMNSGKKHTLSLNHLTQKLIGNGRSWLGSLRLNFYGHTKTWHSLTVMLRGFTAILTLFTTNPLTMFSIL